MLSRSGDGRIDPPEGVEALGVEGAALCTWPAEASVARTGAGADPRWVWDPEAEALPASGIDRGDVPTVNALLRTWKTNAQPLPADVRDFVERARPTRRSRSVSATCW